MKQYTIEGARELRFLITSTTTDSDAAGDSSSPGHVCLKSGNAEIFGRELRMKEWVALPAGSYAVYTWYGCTVEIDETKCEKIHQVSDTPMDIYAGVHGNLELLRDAQVKHDHQGQTKVGGPRVAVVGPGRCGKSTVANILTAYAVRCDRTPLFIDLDTTNNSLSIPGTVTATKVTGPKDIDTAYGILTKGPLTYYTGYVSPWEHTEIFLGAVESLGKSLDERLQNDINDSSGMIIDTFPLTDMDNSIEYQTLLSSVKLLKVDVVLVIGHVRLSQELWNEMKSDGVQVIKMPSPGDVMKRPEKGLVISESIRKYFEGSALMPFQPCRKVIKSKDKFRVYKLQNKPVTDSAILPIGQASVIEPRNYDEVEINALLEKSVLGISYAKTVSELSEPKCMKNVAGFIYVEKVETDPSGDIQIDILSPCPADIPGTIFIKGISRAKAVSELRSQIMKNVAGFVDVEKVETDPAGGIQIDILSTCPADIPGTIFIKGEIKVHEL